MDKYDYVVLGSGFGGATVALRLAEAGKSVLILERGRRWRGKNLLPMASDPPSTPFPEPGDDNFFWSRRPFNPFRKRLGLYEMRQFTNLQGLTAAGVGGGSLIWANVVVQAHEEAFSRGWPSGVDLDELAPYYQRARQYLRPSKIPGLAGANQELTGAESAPRIERAYLHKQAAECLGMSWMPVDVAVNFANEKLPQANGFGARQLGCNFCGLCTAGCPQNAKNSADLTYIAAAEANGAELRAMHEVTAIEALGHGSAYKLHTARYDDAGRCVERIVLEANHVVLSCGTFGSTELLLRSRAKGLLRGLSTQLGTRFSINGNVLSAALDPHGNGRGLNNGPAIVSMIDFGKYAVEDISNPTWAAGMYGGSSLSKAYYFLRAYLGFKMTQEEIAALARDMLIYVGVGLDSASGRLSLNPFGKLSLSWPGLKHEEAIEAQHRAQRAIAESLGRQYVADVFSSFGRQFTYHPLGGCPMGETAESGVVNEYGEVFGHSGLYVIDGSMVPSALGRNPSYTICALAERAVQNMFER